MNLRSLRIIYMGTPDFAVLPLDTLIQAGCNVVGVITASDRPAGRGKKIRHSAVKQFILENHPEIPILQATNLKDPAFVKELENLEPRLQIVVAFRMLPEVIWRIPDIGTFNLHASLLPQYRGAAPINHAIINGETETGVTTFMIDEQIDTGNILLQEKTSIGQEENAGELHDRLMEMGAELVLKTVIQLTEGQLKPQSQDQFLNPETTLKIAPKIFRENCRINWEVPGNTVYNQIRGLSPYPGAFTFLSMKQEGDPILCKIFSATFETTMHKHFPAAIQTDGKKYLDVAVSDGIIRIHSIQQEGKRRMDIRDFLAGINLTSDQCRFS